MTFLLVFFSASVWANSTHPPFYEKKNKAVASNLYTFVNGGINMQGGETVSICMQRNTSSSPFAALSVSFVNLVLNDPNGNHMGDFDESLSFLADNTQACFDFTLPSNAAAGVYTYNILGHSSSLEIEVTSKLYCGVYKKENSASITEKAFSDRFGNYYTSEELTMNPANSTCASAGYFLLEFATSFTQEEEATICQAFSDVSDLFNSQHSAIPIRIKKENIGEDISGAATAIYRANLLNEGCGIEQNLVWEHINTSADFSNILQEDHIIGEFIVNSHPNHSAWHTLDLDGGNFDNPNIEPGLTDLYSLTLHEIMHMLGFESRITADGSPLLGFYSFWDKQLLGTTASVTESPLIVAVQNDPACCDAHEYTSALAQPQNLSINCEDANQDFIIYKYGPLADDKVTVFGEYEDGAIDDPDVLAINQLSHINLCEAGTLAGDEYVMHAGLAPEVAKRKLKDEERSILCNLGYDLIDDTNVSCTEECIVVARDYVVDDPALFLPSGVGGTESILIDYANLTENNPSPQSTTIEVTSCGLISGANILNEPLENRILIHGLVPNTVYTFCYTLEECGSCDEGTITIYTPTNEDLPTWPTVACGSSENLTPWGGFDFEEEEGQYPFYGVTTGLMSCDMLGVNTNNFLPNSPDLLIDASSSTVYLTANVDAENIFCESLYLPLAHPISPGCSATIALDIMTASDFIENGVMGVGNLQIYGSYKSPCLMSSYANCSAAQTDEGFQCIESGVYINQEIPTEEPMNYSITWVNNTDKAISWIVLANNVAALGGNIDQSDRGLLLDNLVVTQDCGQNEVFVNSTVEQACSDGEIIINYEICTDGPSAIAADVSLEAVLPSYPGLVLGQGGDFESTTYVIEGLVPANQDCETVSLVVDVSGSPLVVGNELDIVINVTPTNACIEDPTIVETVVLEECIPIFNCPCEDANIVSYEINAGDGMSFRDTELYTLLVDDVLLGENTLLASNYCISIAGRLIIDPDPSITDVQMADLAILGGGLKMQTNAEIIVEDGAKLSIFHVDDEDQEGKGLHACDYMWEGIIVESGGSLSMNNSYIEDARVAITARNQSNIALYKNVFDNNHIAILGREPGIQTVPISIHTPPQGISANIFDCSEGLLGTWDGTIVAGSCSQTGVRLENVAGFKIGTSVHPANEFRNLQYGVHLLKSQVRVKSALFKDITKAGIYARRNSFLNASNNRFENMGAAIYAYSSTVYGDGNDIDGVEMGVYARLDLLHSLELLNNDIDAKRYCIAAYNSSRANQILIENNTLTLNSQLPAAFLASPRAALRIDDPLENAQMNDAIIRRNIITVNGKGDGVNLWQSGKIDVHYNNIHFQNPLNPENSKGISLLNSDDNYFYNNTVTADPGFVGTSAFGIEASEDNRFCCNSTDNTSIGFHFKGNCTKTFLRNSEIGNHGYGLRCESETKTGLQTDASNRWLGSYAQAAAFHGGNDDDISSSIFKVASSVGTVSWPLQIQTPLSTQQWFVPSENGLTTCLEDVECQDIPTNEYITEVDIKRARGEYDNGVYSLVSNWEKGMQLYGILDNNTNLLGVDEDLVDFRNNELSTIGAYYAVQNNMKSIFELEENQQSGYEQNLSDLELIWSELSEIEDAYLLANSLTDSLQLELEYQVKVNELSSLWQEMGNMYDDQASLMESSITVVDNENEVLIDLHLPAINQKSINALLCKTKFISPIHYSEKQIMSLENIAYQCPLLGGNAVYRARSILLQYGDYSFDDDLSCSAELVNFNTTESVFDTDNVGVTHKQWVVSPNPTTNKLYLSGGERSKLIEVSVYDLNGRLQKTWNREVLDNALELDFLINGVYYLQIKEDDGNSVVKKISIIK